MVQGLDTPSASSKDFGTRMSMPSVMSNQTVVTGIQGVTMSTRKIAKGNRMTARGIRMKVVNTLRMVMSIQVAEKDNLMANHVILVVRKLMALDKVMIVAHKVMDLNNLAGCLVAHKENYRTWVESIRVVCHTVIH